METVGFLTIISSPVWIARGCRAARRGGPCSAGRAVALVARAAEDRIDDAGFRAGELDVEPDRHLVRRDEEALRAEAAALAVGAVVVPRPVDVEGVRLVIPAPAAVEPGDAELRH